jgi:glutaredoxin
MSATGKTLIGVYKADGGILGELSYFFGHLVGVKSCSLCDITHSPVKKKTAFKAFEKRLLEERNISFRLVHMNERTEAELAASKGREPCVLLQYEDGSISMFLDYVELKTYKGSVKSFERLVESRLNIYL